jgi:serine/threonine protein kinase
LLSSTGEAVIADLDVAKQYSSLASAQKFSVITTAVGTPKWMSPEMRKAVSDDVDTNLPKSDIFSLGLISLFCLDTHEFNKSLSPLLKEFKFKMLPKDVIIYLEKFERHLLTYLDDFRLRNVQCPSITKFFYMLKSMLSFSPCARPSIQQLYEDFPLLRV